jgi:hypothetical protein
MTIHDIPALDRADVDKTRYRWAAPGFVRNTVLPLAGFAAALSVVAGSVRAWHSITRVGVVLPVALLIQWAITTHRVVLRGGPIRPVAAGLAVFVMLLGIVAAAALIVAVMVDPALLSRLDAWLRGAL